MSTEPEREIEKELRAYAQQRRADSGPPPELHPATRKLLQDEAARSVKNTAAPSRLWARLFWGSWPRAVAAASFAAIVLLAACWIFVPVFSKSKRQTFASRTDANRDREALDQQKSYQHEAPVAAAEPALTLKKDLMDSKAETRAKSAPATAPGFAGAEAQPKLAPAPAAVSPPPSPAPAPAKSLDQPQEIHVFSDSAGIKLAGETSPLAIGGNRPAAANPSDIHAGEFATAVPTTVTQTFTRMSRSGNAAKVPQAAPAIRNVLATFNVEQENEKLRVIDNDGSVYLGYVTPASETAKAPAGQLAGGSRRESSQAIGTAKAVQPQQFYRFRVSGTNLTLKQEVVFTGNFFASNGVALSGQPPAGNGRVFDKILGEGGDLAPLELGKSLLEGSAWIGVTNKINIHALPKKP